MPRFIDLTGRKFTSQDGQYWLKVLEHVGKSPTGISKWRCRCKCGNECIRYGNGLMQTLKGVRMPRCRTCGLKVIAQKVTKHGESKTRIYWLWRARKAWGTLCEEWQEFEAFRDFFKSVGYPAKNQWLARPDRTKPMGPNNYAIRDHGSVGFEHLPVSRQRKWQLWQKSLGNCSNCGKPSNNHALCQTCYKRQFGREYRHEKGRSRVSQGSTP